MLIFCPDLLINYGTLILEKKSWMKKKIIKSFNGILHYLNCSNEYKRKGKKRIFIVYYTYKLLNHIICIKSNESVLNKFVYSVKPGNHLSTINTVCSPNALLIHRIATTLSIYLSTSVHVYLYLYVSVYLKTFS